MPFDEAQNALVNRSVRPSPPFLWPRPQRVSQGRASLRPIQVAADVGEPGPTLRAAIPLLTQPTYELQVFRLQRVRRREPFDQRVQRAWIPSPAAGTDLPRADRSW
jgi:hypothetical protein